MHFWIFVYLIFNVACAIVLHRLTLRSHFNKPRTGEVVVYYLLFSLFGLVFLCFFILPAILVSFFKEPKSL
jgi:hypothetical protein